MKKFLFILAAMFAINLILPANASFKVFERNYKQGLQDGRNQAQLVSQWNTIKRSNRRAELQIVYTCSKVAGGLAYDPQPYDKMLMGIYNRVDTVLTSLDRRDDLYFAIGAAQAHLIDGAAVHSAMKGIAHEDAIQQLSSEIYANVCIQLLGAE
ncbi:MAG: hypothetical protein MJK13_09235 [Pseudomonadales bacterium]|nr:hypothetical protein [Pseudomonadales bacterium]